MAKVKTDSSETNKTNKDLNKDLVILPDVFNEQLESITLLKRIKKKVSNKFSFKRPTSLNEAETLAQWLYVFRKDEEALTVCKFLSQVEFTGNYSIWSVIERSLALESRLLRTKGQQQQSATCIKTINKVGFVQERIFGGLYERQSENVQYAIERKDLPGEKGWRIILLSELCFAIELRLSANSPIDELESKYQENLQTLRNITKVQS